MQYPDRWENDFVFFSDICRDTFFEECPRPGKAHNKCRTKNNILIQTRFY